MTNETIGSFIAALRKERGLTQEQLAEKLGVSNRSVSRWENGNSLPDISLMYCICDVLGITMAELLNGARQEKDAQWKDTIHLVLKIAYREKIEKAQKLNFWFAAGLGFLLLSMLARPYLPGLQAGILAGMGIAFQAMGFYHNSKERPLTPGETAVFTAADAPKMKSAGEMVQFAKKSQKANLKQYHTAFAKIAKNLQEQEHVRFAMVAEEFTVDGNPGPWHVGIAVTENRVFLCGEFIAGRVMTRSVLDIYDREEILSVQYTNGKILLKTPQTTVTLRGENLQMLAEKLTEAIKPGR